MYKSRIAVSLTKSKLNFENGQISKTQPDISEIPHEASVTSKSNCYDKIKVMEMRLPDDFNKSMKDDFKTDESELTKPQMKFKTQTHLDGEHLKKAMVQTL